MVRVTKTERRDYSGVKSMFVTKPSSQMNEEEYVIEGPTTGDVACLLKEIFAHEERMQYKKLKRAEKDARKKAKKKEQKNG